jgi:tetratricopeptide (TPR) repeat protein
MGKRLKVAHIIWVLFILILVVQLLGCFIPFSPPAEQHFVNGMNLYADLKYKEAIIEYTKAIELKPNLIAAYDWRGLSYYYSDQFDLAILDFSKAIELDPSDKLAYDNRGLSYIEKGQYDLAIMDFNTLIVQFKGDYNNVFFDRGRALFGQGKYDSALNDFNTDLHINPRNEQGYSYRADIYIMKGETAQAIKDLNKVIELSDDPILINSAKERLSRL